MKETALSEIHVEAGARMMEFAGYNMPVVYTSINDEHLCVRQRVGIFDVSHMGEFILKGPGAAGLVQRLTSNDISVLNPGMAQYSCLPNNQGGIVDDLLVYALEEGNFMLVVNASNLEKDWEWISAHNTEQVEMHNISDNTSLLAIQGPKSIECLQPLTDIDLSALNYYTFTKGTFAGVKNVLVSATGYTGSGGFEIYFRNEHAVNIWNQIMDAGKQFGIQPIGLGARDTLRLEMGYCLYGNDINDTSSPLEAGLGWITKLKNTENQFVARDIIEDLKQKGISKKLVGFEMIDRGIPRQHYSICDSEGNTIGEVTSGTKAPSLEKAIGMGYVPIGSDNPGSEIFIAVRNKLLKAVVVTLPFYQA